MARQNIPDPSIGTNVISNLADRPTLTATELKAKFDKAPNDIISYLETNIPKINANFTELYANMPNITIGTSAPSDGDGSDGDIYIQY